MHTIKVFSLLPQQNHNFIVNKILPNNFLLVEALGKAHNYLFLLTNCCTRPKEFLPSLNFETKPEGIKDNAMIKNSLKENIHSKQNQPVVLKIQFGSDCREGMSLVLSLPLSLALT